MLSFACGRAEAGIPFNAYLPSIQADFSDLDARDAQNRPLKTFAAAGELVQLFHENSVRLLLQQTPHLNRAMEFLLSSFSHLYNNEFLKSLENGLRRFQEAVLRPIRKVVHNVHNLWISSSVDSGRAGLSAIVLSLSRRPQKLYLRC
jgi:hypothetical protein